MASNINAVNIARALFESARKKGESVKWLAELRLVVDLSKDSALSELLAKKGLDFKQKIGELQKRSGQLGPETVDLVKELLEKGKLSQIDGITTEYQRLLDQMHGIEGSQVADVTTAVSLDSQARLDLGEKLTEIMGKPVVVNARVDPAILGGIVIRVGDKLIDGSVRSKLQTISKELV